MTNAVSLAQQASTGVSQGFKNRIINGAMVIDQRNAGASVTMTTNLFTLDRWAGILTQASKYSIQQNAGSVTPPAGFTNYLGVTSLSAYSVGSGDTFFVYQAIEGYNFADLNWGSANAKTVTLSFWVRSSLTGTFGGALTNNAADRSYAFTYTISSANTWEQKSITIPGDTSGTWLTNNLIGANVRLGLGSGSTFTKAAGSWGAGNIVQANGDTSVVGTNGATWYLTGVQFEVGSSSTSFEVRDYGRELMLCQRYYFQTPNVSSGSQIWDCMGSVTSTASSNMLIPVPVTMRANPSVALNPSYNTGSFWNINVPSVNNYPLTATPYLASYSGGACVPIVALHNAMSSSYIGLGVDFYCPTGTSTNNVILSAEL